MAKAGFLDGLSPLRAETAHRAMLLVILALGLIGLAGERIPAGGGLGWDGMVYARMVRDLGAMVAEGQLGSYHAQRILPALVVKAMLGLAGATPTDGAIILAFGLVNLALLLLSCLLWRALADLYGIGIAGRWIGFCGLFLSFQAAKLTWYYSALTDTSALTFGLLTLFLYASGRPLLLLVASILGAFCWPTFGICGALLLLFPRRDPAAPTEAAPTTARPLVLAGVGLSLSALAFYLLLRAVPDGACAGLAGGLAGRIGGSDPCLLARRFLTALPALTGLAVGLWLLIWPAVRQGGLAAHLRRIRPSSVAFALAAVVIPIVIVRIIADPRVGNPSSVGYLARLILQPTEGKMLMPLVGMFVYFGPLVALGVPLWQELAQAARRIGLGAALVIAATLPFGLVGESRFVTGAWPFMVLAVVLALEARPPGRAFAIPFVLVTILLAQFWLPLNVGPWPVEAVDNPYDMPKQMYFMHFGLWMNWASFLGYAALMLVTGLWLLRTLPAARPDLARA